MKDVCIVLMLGLVFLLCVAMYVKLIELVSERASVIKEEPQATEGHIAQTEKKATFEDLLDAIEWVESGGRWWAVGDDGKAVGAYQLHTIYVDDVNRIICAKAFLYADRTDTVKARQMTAIYLKHYGGTFEEMARKHNGGPQGHRKPETLAYWEKVKNRLTIIERKEQ